LTVEILLTCVLNAVAGKTPRWIKKSHQLRSEAAVELRVSAVMPGAIVQRESVRDGRRRKRKGERKTSEREKKKPTEKKCKHEHGAYRNT
jgi:hypothetical protein